jgi:hypothetical protein
MSHTKDHSRVLRTLCKFRYAYHHEAPYCFATRSPLRTTTWDEDVTPRLFDRPESEPRAAVGSICTQRVFS